MNDEAGSNDMHQLTGPFVLGALDDDEQALFETHLATCTACQAEVRGFGDVRDELGRGVAAPAPPGLRARVLAAIADTPQLPPLLATRRRARRRGTGPVLLAAAAVAAVVAGVVGYVRERSERSDAEALVALLTAPDAQTVPLAGDDDASMRVVWSAQRGEAVLVADELADPAPGRDYELWYFEGSEARPAVVFEPDDGAVQKLFDLSGSFDAMAVTVEPDGGSDTPTLPIVYQGAVTTT